MYSTSSNVVCVPTSLLTVSLPLFIVSFLVFAFLIYFYFMYFTVLLASFPFSVILIPFLELDGRNIWEKQNKQCMCLCAYLYICVCVKVDQLCPTLCDPMDCSLPGSSVHGILQAKIQKEYFAIGKVVGCCSLLQEIFLSQGSNLDLLHCRQILYHLSHLGSPLAP